MKEIKNTIRLNGLQKENSKGDKDIKEKKSHIVIISWKSINVNIKVDSNKILI